jgi:protein AroM
MTLGLVTIGQAPRIDVVQAMFGFDAHPGIVEAGALDGFDRERIASLVPTKDEHPLVTRLVDGSEVVVSKLRILGHLQRAIDDVAERGARTICLLCTGEFSSIESPKGSIIIYPDQVLIQVVAAIAPHATLGVLMPHAGQAEMMHQKWPASGRRVVTAAVSPYGATVELEPAVRSLEKCGAQVIVMDCMGFDREMQRRARSCTRVPVLLASGIVGAVLGQLVELG